MYPTWGLYGAGLPGPYPPPPPTLMPPQALSGPLPAVLPAAAAALSPSSTAMGSYGASASAASAPAGGGGGTGGGFLSLQEQHLVQLQQLQRMHQKQLQSVLLGGPPPPPPPHLPPPPLPGAGGAPPWQPSGPPPPHGYQKQFQPNREEPPPPQPPLPPPMPPREGPFRNPPLPPTSLAEEEIMAEPPLPPEEEWKPLLAPSGNPRAEMDMDLSSPPPPSPPPSSYLSPPESLSYGPPPLPPPPPQSQVEPPPPYKGRPPLPQAAVPQAFSDPASSAAAKQPYLSQVPPYKPQAASQPGQPPPSSSSVSNKSEPPPPRFTSSQVSQPSSEPQELRKGKASGIDITRPEQQQQQNTSQADPSGVAGQLKIEPPGDPEESMRLQQLQAAATQWQQDPQQRVGFQYQRIMQKHSQLQEILRRYQNIIQQPQHLPTMSLEMQLQHYETLDKQFQPLFKEWEREFQQWEDQLQAYPHKDQLHECEKQWLVWQGQMKATHTHLQEKVKSLRTISSQYPGSGALPLLFSPYPQTIHSGMPVGPLSLPSAMLPPTSTGFSSEPHTSDTPAPKEAALQSTQAAETRASLFTAPGMFPFKPPEPLPASQTPEMMRPTLSSPSSFTYKAAELPVNSQTAETTRSPLFPPLPPSSSFPCNAADSLPQTPTTKVAKHGSLPSAATFSFKVSEMSSSSSFSFKMSDSSASSHATETSRPPLPTPSSAFSYKNTDKSALPYHSKETSSANSSGQTGLYDPPGKQAAPFGSSEQTFVEAKPYSAVSSSAATAAAASYQNRQAKGAGFSNPPTGYYEGPRGPRFDGPRERFEPPRQRGPRFQGQRLESPRPNLQNQHTDGSSGKQRTIPRGPAAAFYTSSGASTIQKSQAGGPQWQGPRPLLGQDHQTENKESFTEMLSNQAVANKSKFTLDTKDSGPIQQDKGLSKAQQNIPRNEGVEVMSELKKQYSAECGLQTDVSNTSTDPSAAPHHISASILPPQAGGKKALLPSPMTGNKDLKSAENKLETNQNKDQTKAKLENREMGQIKPGNNQAKGPAGRGQGRMEGGRGRGRFDDVRGRGMSGRGRGQTRDVHGRDISSGRGIHDKFLGNQTESWESGMGAQPDGQERALGRQSSSHERMVPDPQVGARDKGCVNNKERGFARPFSGQEWGLDQQAYSQERGPGQGDSNWEKDTVRRPGSQERDLHLYDAGHGSAMEKFSPFHEEPHRPPWAYGDMGIEEERSFDYRDIPPQERRHLEDWERDRYWHEPEQRYHDDSLDPYERDDLLPRRHPLPPLSPLPPLPPLSADLNRREPYWDDWERPVGRDREIDRDLDRIRRPLDVYNREFDRDWDRDYVQPQERDTVSCDLDIPPLPPLPPLDRYHEDRWLEERDRDFYDQDLRDRGELRIRDYPERSDTWRERSDFPSGRGNWDRERFSDRWYPDEGKRFRSLEDDLEPPPMPPRSEILGEEPNEQTSGGVMMLSQRQHEIILRAAQELKMLREQKEHMHHMKEFLPEPQIPEMHLQEMSRSQNMSSRRDDFEAEIPVDEEHIKPPMMFQKPSPAAKTATTMAKPSVPPMRPHDLTSMAPLPTGKPLASLSQSSVTTPICTAAPTHISAPVVRSSPGMHQECWDEDSFPGLWDSSDAKGLNSEYDLSASDPSLPSAAVPSSVAPGMSPLTKPPLIHQTVDYGHGHSHGQDAGACKGGPIPYGERITLHPEPIHERQTFSKEHPHPGQRDRYIKERETYFERQNNTNSDHRDFRREREPYRDRISGDHERERFEKERYAREREDRPSPSRTQSYRDKEHSNSRRGGYERQPYERKSDRPPYDHGPPVYGGDRRNYPEDRMSLSAPSIPRQPPPTPRVEKKPESKNVDDILKPPGRQSRPERIVIIMRGLPGSGKSHVAKLIRDKEVEGGGAAPRILSLDDYFIIEIEKEERDPDTKKRVKKKVLEYEFEADMEEVYRASLFKTFKKTLDDGFFPFIILDAINDKVRHFEQFWSAAKTKGFEVYLAEITADNQTCCKRNVHGRKLKEISKMADHWETAPRHMIRLDIRSLLQDAAIEEVEMEDFDANIEDQKEDKKDAEEEESELGYIPKSKWEMDTSEAKLDKLDGLRTGAKRKRDWEAIASRMEDYLQLPDDYDTRASEPGKKRVRWADLEEKKDADRKRAIGFVVGQTDWEKITDESGHFAEKALNRTKYI